MRKNIIAIILLISMLFCSCSNINNVQSDSNSENKYDLSFYKKTAEPLDEVEKERYEDIITELLDEDLWTTQDAYDTAHYLMVPMHYAYKSSNQNYVNMYQAFFNRFVDDVILGNDNYGFKELPILYQLHFSYLISQYLVLSYANGYPVDNQELLFDFVEDVSYKLLFGVKCGWTGEKNFVTRVEKVLDGYEYEYKYQSAIPDNIWFSLAILSDSKVIDEQRYYKNKYAAEIDDLAYRIFSDEKQNVVTEDGGWLFQVGAWSDYKDYNYAGNEKIYPEIQPKIREDITNDSSHFLRIPLMLHSYLSAQTEDKKIKLFQNRIQQLSYQMKNKVLKNIDGKWLTTTFMDGTNGVYRYEYHESGVGIEGYDLSGSFLLGWWSFLEDPDIKNVYIDILNLFPMEGNQSNPYFDHTTVRQQNKYFDADTAFVNGMYELLVACASKL